MIKPSLIVLTPGFAANEADTSCLPMQQNFIKTLKKKFPDLDIIILAFQYPPLASNYQWEGSSVISFNGKNRRRLYRMWLWSKVWQQLKRLHRNYNIIGLLSFWYGECALIGNRFAKKHSLKHYCWIFGQDAKAGNKYVTRARLKSEELIALSDFLQNEFERNYGIKPLAVIPPGVEAPPMTDVERDIDLIGVGSLIPLKRFEIFVEIVAAVRAKAPSVKAMLIGEGPERSRLEKIIRASGLEENVILRGKLSHSEVLDHMNRARILLHPSVYEGFSGVCLEALSMGAHVISFCRPMETDIDQWYIVNTKEQMIQKTIAVLTAQAAHKRMAFRTMDNVVQRITDLFFSETLV